MTDAAMSHSGFDAQFRAGLAAGELRVARCRSCGATLPFAARRCPSGGAAIDWIRASGDATLVSWTVYHQSFGAARPVPYIVGEVQLQEGPRLVAALDLGATAPRQGLALRLGEASADRVCFAAREAG